MKLFLVTVIAALLHSQVSARSQSTSLGFGDGVSNTAPHITQPNSLRDAHTNVGAFPSGVGGGSLSGLGSFPSDAFSAGFGANPGLGPVASIPRFPTSNLLPFPTGFGSPFSTDAGVSPFFGGSVIPSIDFGAPFPSLPGVPGLNGLPGILPFPSPLQPHDLSSRFNPFSSNRLAPLTPFASTPLFLPSTAGVAPFSSGLGFSTPSQLLTPFV